MSQIEAVHAGFASLTSATRLAAAAASVMRPETERVRALRQRSGFELMIDPRRSLETLAEARAIAGSCDSPQDRHEQRLRELIARCHALEDVSLREVCDALDAPMGGQFADPVVRRPLIPWLLVTGETARARQWLRACPRDVDPHEDCVRPPTNLATEMVRVAEGMPPVALHGPPASGDYAISPAVWLRLHVNCYWDLIDGNIPEARRRVERIRALHSQVPPMTRHQLPALEALVAALDGAREVSLPLPNWNLSLFSLGPALMGAEAVALCGTRDQAAAWYDWFECTWPAHILRAPAWPVLAHRVRALLASRAGELAVGLRWMEEAIIVADRIGSPVESAVARVQCAELLAIDATPDAQRHWREVVQSGAERSRALGIPHEHHAYRADTIATLGRYDLMAEASDDSDSLDPGLTPREVEVLRLFSLGHSYRQAGEILGVGWRTVQSHAYNAYQKLGVSSKIAAVTAASRLHLL